MGEVSGVFNIFSHKLGAAGPGENAEKKPGTPLFEPAYLHAAPGGMVLIRLHFLTQRKRHAWLPLYYRKSRLSQVMRPRPFIRARIWRRCSCARRCILDHRLANSSVDRSLTASFKVSLLTIL